MRKIVEKVLNFLARKGADRLYEFIYSRFYFPFFFKLKMIHKNEGIIIFEDGSFLNRMGFIYSCSKKNKDWIEEMEKLRKECDPIFKECEKNATA